MSKLYYLLPKKLRKPADILKRKIFNLGFSKYCPICNSSIREFKPFKSKQGRLRINVKCPVCESFERHRFFWLLLKKETDLFDGDSKKMLHIAPEKALMAKFQQISHLDYLSADLVSPLAMVKMDITAIDYPDNYFDVIYCSHVLEHIPDDNKALSELYRVLSPNGWMLLSVPMKDGLEITDEDLTIQDPSERVRRFGNVDHMRIYGKDFDEKLKSAGLKFDKKYPSDVVNSNDFSRFGLKDDFVYICRK